MPMTGVQLIPGVNVERTAVANSAGISQSQLLRYKDGMVQTLGGWQSLFGTIPSTIRALHAWQDTNAVDWLGIGAINNLVVVNSNSNGDITPGTLTTNPTPNFSISSGSATVTVVDANGAASIYNNVYFNTPVAIGNLLLNGAYPIVSALSTGSYTITSSVVASTTIASSGILPTFSVSSGSPTITVGLPNHNVSTVLGEQIDFRTPTTVGSIVVSGKYNVASVINSSTFTINATIQSTATATATMNSSLAQLVYYITIGQQVSGSGFGAGGFGSGGYGSGSGSTSIVTGNPLATTDWSLDNWGEILLSCPSDGAIYTWSPHSGFQNAQVISAAPFFNGGIFISMPQQILVAWKSVQNTGTQDNLIVRWSDALDYANWTVSNQTTAGSFHIPTGSIIRGGLQAPNYGVIWTDVDVWMMSYIGGDIIFNFTRVGTGCGLVGQHAAGVINNEVYWCGLSNFFKLGQSGVEAIPCSVWDYIFQNLNATPTNASKVFCAPNSAFNEITWFFPSKNATECDSYVKYNILEKEWDYGSMSRTAWIDISVLGNPIAADNTGIIYQHEVGQSFPGTPVTSFRTGWWAISEGNDLSFVDWFLPDFKWGLYSGSNDSQINVTLYAVDYPGDTPRTYGPFTVTQATEYLNPRLRGRLMSMLVTSNNSIFWRLGHIRYRAAPSGRR